MLVKLTEKYTEALSKELQKLSKQDREFFCPHEFDIKSVRSLINEKGNHYYAYLDDSGNFVGYGMLRTLGKYKIPTLGCAVWQLYRGKKHGNKLVKELLDKAQELGYQKVKLKVHQENTIALQSYIKAGFEKTGLIEGKNIWMEYTQKTGSINAG